MPIYTIELTEGEELAMQYIALSANAWIQHAVHDRARAAMDEIVKEVVPKFLDNNITVPATKEEIIVTAYNNGYIKPAANTFAEIITNAPGANVVPYTVSAYQAKSALLAANLYYTVENMINSSNNMQMKLAWFNATEFQRDNIFISSLANNLGLTQEQIDQLFITAAQIK
jgi:hypothetical protein